MKHLLIVLLFPLFTLGQTVHHDGEKIVYEGNVKLDAGGLSNMQNRLQNVLADVAGKMADSILIRAGEDAIQAAASIRMNSPYAIIRKMHFTLQLAPHATGYTYTVDSIVVTEKRRGWKEKSVTSEEMIDNLEETGNAAIELEITLNEIDLRIQKLLRVLENKMKQESPGRESNTGTAASNGPATQ
ncbi:MAG TPA: hypothetical protein VGE06_12575 [Flavisolibacter sp.]